MSTIQESDELEISLSLVTDLIAEQFPQWTDLSIKPVPVSGIDNRMFRLGEEMLIRLPSAEEYSEQVKKEQKWLPLIASGLSFRIPEPLAMGKPSKIYPWNWSIYRWLEGESANTLQIHDLNLHAIGSSLAQFLNELHKINVNDGPLGGLHNYYRGTSPAVYDTETRMLIHQLRKLINAHAATNIWEKALQSKWSQCPVWIHGDLASGNILVKNGLLAAIIDFGCIGVGDPACDLVIAWTLLTKESRCIFKSSLSLDMETWARARGWALWKALFELGELKDKKSLKSLKQQQVIDEILSE
jgi:aminoglycoside phosphotransferase (APT) family kinase protein